MNIFFLVLFTFSTAAFGQSVITCPDYLLAPKTEIDNFAQFAETCSPQARKSDTPLNPFVGQGVLVQSAIFNFANFEKATKSEFCRCATSKMNEARVPMEGKFLYGQKDLDKATAKVFQKSLKNLFLNVTKFKNMNLTKELHNKSKTMCSPEAIVASVKDSCPGPAFDEKAKNVFGDEGIDAYAVNVTRDLLTIKDGSNACITKQEFLRLRSANKTSGKAMELAKDATSIHDVFHKDYANFDNVQFAKLLSYDPLFSLGYQYNDFNISLRKILKQKYDNKDEIQNVDEKIYDDEEVQKSAYESIEKNCGEMKKHLKSFMCSDPVAKSDVKNTSLLIDSSMDVSKLGTDPNAKQSTKDYHTGLLACGTDMGWHQMEYNSFLESNIFANRIIPDMVSDSESSEYSKFNKTFCNGRKEFSMQRNDLAGMMKDFFDAKKNAQPPEKPIDLRKIFEDKGMMRMLNLKVNVDALPTFTSYEVENGETPLPELGSPEFSQNISVAEMRLKQAGLTSDEVQQLFGLIEMQTNARNAEIRVVTERFRENHPDMKNISPVQIDSMLRGYNVSDLSFNQRYVNTVATLSDAQGLYIDEQTRRQERFQVPPDSQSGLGNTASRSMPTPVATPVVEQKPQENIANSAKTAEALTKPTSGQETKNEAGPQDKKPQASLTVSSTNSNSTSGSGSGSSYSGASASSSGSSSSSSSSYSGGSYDSGSGSSYSSSSSSDFDNSPSSTGNSYSSSTYKSPYDDEIKRLQQDIDNSRRQLNDSAKKIYGGGTVASNTNTNRSQPSGYKYPKNLPVKTQNGDYYQPEAQGSELSSASNAKEKESKQDSVTSAGGGGGSGSAGGEGRAAGRGGPVSFGGGGIGGGGGASSGSGRGPASAGSAATSFVTDAAVFEFNKYLPHSIFDVMGSIDKVIMLLGLEGKSFKTIEAIEETDPETGKIVIKYYERTFDFIPTGKFEKFKDLFSTKEDRAKAFKEYFSFPRTKENLGLSKQYSLATRQLKKEEVPHSYVLNIQNYILSDDEIRDTMKEAMDKLK